MDIIKDALLANIKASELRSALYNKVSDSNITIADINKAEDYALQITKDALSVFDEQSDNYEYKSARDSIVSKSKEIEKISENFNYIVKNITALELSTLGMPVGSVTEESGNKTCELSIDLPVGTKLYTTQLIDPSNIKELSIEDIKSFVNMGNLEGVIIPIIEKAIIKFKIKNNIGN